MLTPSPRLPKPYPTKTETKKKRNYNQRQHLEVHLFPLSFEQALQVGRDGAHLVVTAVAVPIPNLQEQRPQVVAVTQGLGARRDKNKNVNYSSRLHENKNGGYRVAITATIVATARLGV